MITDAPLSSLATEYAKAATSEESGQSKAYRILLGIHAAEEDDALEVGSERIAHYREAAGDAGTLDEVEFSDYPKEQAIYVPKSTDHPLYCYIRDAGCLDEIALDSDGRRTELVRLNRLIERYDSYLSAEDFRTELAPAMNEPWPDYYYLFVANRMRIFAAYDKAQNNQAAEATEGLLSDITRLRSMLAKSDNLVHKVVTAAQIGASLDALAHLYAYYHASLIQPIPALTADERSFRKPLLHEFHLQSPLAFPPSENKELWSEEFGRMSWLSRRTYHPNMVVNALARRVDQQVQLSEVTAAAFAESSEKFQIDDSEFFSIFPSVNEYMNELSELSYLKYIGRVFDLDAKISLVNSRVARGNIPPENPYYPGQSAELYEDDGRLCMEGPLPDEKHTRCLPLMADSEIAYAD